VQSSATLKCDRPFGTDSQHPKPTAKSLRVGPNFRVFLSGPHNNLTLGAPSVFILYVENIACWQGAIGLWSLDATREIGAGLGLGHNLARRSNPNGLSSVRPPKRMRQLDVTVDNNCSAAAGWAEM